MEKVSLVDSYRFNCILIVSSVVFLRDVKTFFHFSIKFEYLYLLFYMIVGQRTSTFVGLRFCFPTSCLGVDEPHWSSTILIPVMYHLMRFISGFY